MFPRRLELKGHDFRWGKRVCGLARRHYDGEGQPWCPVLGNHRAG
jgi:hypothetical protein